MAGEAMEKPGSIRLGRHHLAEARRIHPQQQAVVEHTRCVKNTPQGRQRRLDPFEHSRQIRRVRDVSLHGDDLGPLCFQGSQFPGRVGADAARPSNTRWRAPRFTSHDATARPSPPNPPVMR